MFSPFQFRVDVPALDRLMDYLESNKQAEIDACTAQIVALTARLKKTNDLLQISLKGKV